MIASSGWFSLKLISLLSLSFLIVGCGQTNGNPTVNRPHLETEVQLSLPNDVILLNSDDGGRQDPNYEYYEWLLYSSSGFIVPAKKASLSIETTLRDIESLKPNRKIPQPTNAFATDWETQQFYFRAVLLQTSDGEFLLIERFRK